MGFQKLSGRTLLLGAVFLFLALISAGIFLYKPSNASNLNQRCLLCHSIKGRPPKILLNGDKMYLYVNPEKFKKSVHGRIPCMVCHVDINVRNHPRPIKIASKKAYMREVSRRCLMCHPVKRLSSFHKDVLKYSKISCAECHGSHYIKSAEAVKNQTLACLQCHSVKGREPKILKNGDKMYLYVNKEKFLRSPHAKMGCLSCHVDIKPEKHPRPLPLKSIRSYARKVNQRCIICHPLKTLSKHPGHAIVIRDKRFLCTDCHTYHEGQNLNLLRRSNTDAYCLMCHRYNLKGAKKVSPEEISSSVHKLFRCIVCHTDFMNGKHPIYKFKNKKEGMAYFSKKVCQRCHTDAQLRKNPAHYALTKKASCIECHGYHTVQAISNQVKNISENTYCLRCHSKDIKMRFADGEEISLKVDRKVLIHSVHKNFRCSECHTGYSKNSHPIHHYKSLADFRKAGDKICAKCHAIQYKQFLKSVHYAKRTAGDASAPGCIGCHGYHDVKYVSGNKALSVQICSKCHKNEASVLEESVHAKTLSCISCHGIHAVKAIAEADVDKSCVRCHKNMEAIHAQWLHNPPFQEATFVKLHFKKASCVACHTGVDKHVMLSIVNREDGKAYGLTKELVQKFDANNNGKLEEKELWDLMSTLKEKQDVTLDGKITVVDRNAAHKVISKDLALRDCAACHSPAASFKVTLKGQPVERAVLNSFNIIPNMRDFYAIGLTKVKVLDIVFILAVLAGLGFVCGHIGLRIITTPIRRKRREGK